MAWQAKKSFGQHALHDVAIGRRLVEALAVQMGEGVVEVGPGDGALTRHIVALYPSAPLHLVEADRDLFDDLRDRFPNAELIEGDAGLVDYARFTAPWHFLSNLPYNSSATILTRIFTTQSRLQSAVIIAQKEQAQRMLAPAGEMSLLSLATQLYATGKLLFDIAPGAFSPPPNVDSRALILFPRDRQNDEEAILNFARPAFSSRRKQLKKTLSEAHDISQQHIADTLVELNHAKEARPQELTPEDWRTLYRACYAR